MSRLAPILAYLVVLQMLLLVYLPEWGPERTLAVGACSLAALVLMLRVPTGKGKK